MFAKNDVVRRALVLTNVLCVLEPSGLSRTDGKRPDGLTLVPWKDEKCLIWYVTCVSIVAAYHLSRTVSTPSAVSEDAANRKRMKCAELLSSYHYVPVAVETMYCWGSNAKQFISEIGKRLIFKTGDSCASLLLAQRLAVSIKRGNADSVMCTFAPGRPTCTGIRRKQVQLF